MKALVVETGSHFSTSDVFDGLFKGLRANGVDVARFTLNDRLNFYSEAHMKREDGSFVPAFSPEDAVRIAAKGISAACYEWWPEVVIIVSGPFIPPEVWGTLARRPPHVVYWCTESPYEDDRQANPAPYADTVILNDPTNLEHYRANLNARTFYMPHSYDPDRHHPGPAVAGLASDFAFVGTGFESRIDFFEAVDFTGIDAVLGGNWQLLTDDSPLNELLLHPKANCLDNADTADVYRSTKVTANLYRKEASEKAHADGWAMGPREVELAACGSFFLREPRPEGDELFPQLPTFETSEGFEELLRWWLARPEQRETAAVAATAAIADRTFTNTASSLLRLVDGHTKTMR